MNQLVPSHCTAGTPVGTENRHNLATPACTACSLSCRASPLRVVAWEALPIQNLQTTAAQDQGRATRVSCVDNPRVHLGSDSMFNPGLAAGIMT